MPNRDTRTNDRLRCDAIHRSGVQDQGERGGSVVPAELAGSADQGNLEDGVAEILLITQ